MVYKRNKSPGEIADIIERFVYRVPSAQQIKSDLEWGDLLDSGVSDPELNLIVKQCEVINREFLPQRGLSPITKQQRELDAEERLKLIATQLRNWGGGSKV